MAAFKDESLLERDNQYNTDEINYGRFTDVATPDPDDDLIDDDDDLDSDLDDDTLDDDTDFDDDDFDEADLDEEDDDLEDPIAESDGDIDDDINENPEPNFSPDETPEREEAEGEDARYPDEGETRPDQNESGTNWSEQVDVTPPRPHEFPGEGNTKANFESRPHGRTTGRMISDDPGTEGI